MKYNGRTPSAGGSSGGVNIRDFAATIVTTKSRCIKSTTTKLVLRM